MNETTQGGAIGYNAAKINALMNSISTAYTNLSAQVTANYGTLSPILRREWVGEDELDFEKKLVDRLNMMYYNAGLLSQAGVNAVRNIADSWKEFQSKNIFSSGETNVRGNPMHDTVHINATFEDVTVTPVETLIEFQNVTYGDDVDRGLRQGTTSYTQIIEALETFKSTTQTDAKNFTSEFDINSAFMGGTEQGIKTFLEYVENSISAVLTAVKDFVDGLQKLANTNYTTATSTVNEYATGTAKTEVEKLVTDAVGESRWGDTSN